MSVHWTKVYSVKSTEIDSTLEGRQKIINFLRDTSSMLSDPPPLIEDMSPKEIFLKSSTLHTCKILETWSNKTSTNRTWNKRNSRVKKIFFVLFRSLRNLVFSKQLSYFDTFRKIPMGQFHKAQYTICWTPMVIILFLWRGVWRAAGADIFRLSRSKLESLLVSIIP